jgi:NAD(P)-dependent dehydrogenase (short-subunit alcohol dehydrogenase family)
MPTLLITGANRGLGLELTREFARRHWRVLACCRSPEEADELQVLAAASETVAIHRLEVGDIVQVRALAGRLKGTPIDILLNNAGIFGPERQGFGETDEAGWLEAFRINSIAPLHLAEAFVEHVAASERRVIATMGSVMGSVTENDSGGAYAYRSSKAAVHMVMKGLAVDLAPRGVVAVVLHPGWVQTRMGGGDAPLKPEESAAGLTEVLLGLRREQSGQLIDYQGHMHPW